MALYFQNGTGETVWIAFAYYDPSCGEVNQLFRKQGWWRLDPFSAFDHTDKWRLNAWDVDLRKVNRFAYFYATTANIASSWSGTGNGWLTVNPEARFDQCAFDSPGNSLWANFVALDFTWADPGWNAVVTLWRWEGVNRKDFSQQQGTVSISRFPAPGWGI